ncbi:HAD family hydrolase [Bifidobacterium avesanii]|uniref:HAD family hydrolase n=1 Tax=Bifidobacterium avesanii TaxID=1798157 RepID=A0A7K3TI35_9BIFI|nr:haloacid dehalogenase-like hydrolase [Bifidobacterium avesanii]KAB8291444.1 haloacid dehalogenase [Bifidobacterium avesanii]NEG77923.1 HAD family hydrolase [Bifidobacterium avesanii]
MTVLFPDRKVVVFDFDGTVCLGAAPVWAYADAVFDHMTEPDAERARGELGRFLDDPSAFPGCEDAYDVVQRAAARTGVPAETSGEAYLASRHALAQGAFDVRAPEGLGAFLGRLADAGRACVLVTNSPLIGLKETLARFGVLGLFDAILPGSGKPGGWPEVIRRLIGDKASDTDATNTADGRGERAHRLLSIGDHWVNDIAPVAAAGYATAYIHDPVPGREPTFCAPRLADMTRDILDRF